MLPFQQKQKQKISHNNIIEVRALNIVCIKSLGRLCFYLYILQKCVLLLQMGHDILLNYIFRAHYMSSFWNCKKRYCLINGTHAQPNVYFQNELQSNFLSVFALTINFNSNYRHLLLPKDRIAHV